ncbi:MAG: RidA family protein [Paracoccaceae bacterium]
MESLFPEGWKAPVGYANGLRVPAAGHLVFIAGQVGWNARQVFESDALVAQFDQALANVIAVLERGGGAPHHICRMTCFCVDRQEYLNARRELGGIWRKHMGSHYPAMSMIFVSDLLDHPARIELEATALVPDEMP